MLPQIEALEHHAEPGADALELAAVGGMEIAVLAGLQADLLAGDGDAPLVGISRKLMQRRKVLLPEPEAPIIDTTSPSCAVSDTPFSTSRRPKLLCRSSTTTAGWPFGSLPPAHSPILFLLCESLSRKQKCGQSNIAEPFRAFPRRPGQGLFGGADGMVRTLQAYFPSSGRQASVIQGVRRIVNRAR